MGVVGKGIGLLGEKAIQIFLVSNFALPVSIVRIFSRPKFMPSKFFVRFFCFLA